MALFYASSEVFSSFLPKVWGYGKIALMLKIENLRGGYNDMEILKGVSMEVNPAEVVSIIGPNGAGKTTVLKSIFDLAKIYEGKIFFEDNDITNLKTFELIDLGISFVPQGRQIFSHMTVLENLEMGAYYIKDKVLAEERIHEVLNKYPVLEKKRNDLASSLSGGQQQLLAIARALVQKPKLLLLDEPSLGLSPKVMKEIFNTVLQIKNEGVAILMVEQNAKQAVSVSDRTYVLEAGEVALTGGREILDNSKIKDIYFGGY